MADFGDQNPSPPATVPAFLLPWTVARLEMHKMDWVDGVLASFLSTKSLAAVRREALKPFPVGASELECCGEL